MALISIIFCLLAERFISSLHTVRSFSWLEKYTQVVFKSATSKKYFDGSAGVIIFTLPLPIIVGLVDLQLQHLFPLFKFIFSTAILFYSFGPETFYDRTKEFRNAMDDGNSASACWYAERILRRRVDDSEKQQLSNLITKSLFIISNDRIFAPIFWFLVLGPMGAMLYRCCSRLVFIANNEIKQQGLSHAALVFIAVLDWIPARLSAFSYALMGNFMGAIYQCRQSKTSFVAVTQAANNDVLCCLARGAISLPIDSSNSTHQISQAMALIRRSIECWLAAIAVLTLSGTL